MGLRFGPIRLGRRGVRVRIGPRIARLHVGTGAAGISTGVGPFSAYAPLSGKRRRRTQPKAPVFHGTLPDGWKCQHRHRTEAAAIGCARQELRRRQAGG
jgi:hypothetical protein